MKHGRTIRRRRFLKQAASAVGAPYVVSSSALGIAGAVTPSNRITVGLIGCGLHGAGWNLDQIFRNEDTQVVAVCDVDAARAAAAKAKVDKHYGEAGVKTYRGCDAMGDFRDLIMRKDIDVIANCTPDHWHVIPAIMAAKAGKDVICEKPLTLTVTEGRTLCEVMKITGRIFQTASENRSIDTYIQMCELVRNGRIGKVQHIEVRLPVGNTSRGENFTQREMAPVPAGFNYEMWQGQAPAAPYIPARIFGSFRWNLAYSGGVLTDWGAHLIDLAQWALDMETSGPTEVEGKGDFPPRDAVFNTTPTFDIDYKYASGVTMKVSSTGPGIRFEGTEGWIGFDGWRTPLEASSTSILKSRIGADEVRLYRPNDVVPREAGRGGEHRNFIDCVKSRRPCYAPAETGHRTSTISHLGNIAMLLGRKVRWDPAKERFVNDAEADGMLSRTQREPWTIANIDGWIRERS